jgi:F-type H+-transporting ATPase subunit c
MNAKKIVVSLLVMTAVMAISGVAFADENTATIAKSEIAKWAALGGGLGIGIAAFGGALGQGRAAAAALDGIARNPSAADKLFTPMILGLALIESLVIYALIIAFVLVLK